MKTGLYEQLIDDQLAQALADFTGRLHDRELNPADSHLALADHLSRLLASLPGAQVRVSYDVQRTRLHAKAYLFERASGFGSACIGSANLSRPALTEGLEWTVKISQYASPAIWRKVAGTFETYWNDPEFESYDESQHARLVSALRREPPRPALNGR